MAAITWDQVGERKYETGVDRGVLYPISAFGTYPLGVGWNGLTAVTESPSGAEASPVYADNQKYLNMTAAEEFGYTIEALTYPDEFEECDGTAEPVSGVTVSQQRRKVFGFSYRTLLGNDVDGNDHGYKIHLVYGSLAAPSEKANATVNDSPEAMTFSWEVTTTPVDVPNFKPAAHLVINSTKTDPAKLADFEAVLYGSPGVDPRLPLPAEVFSLISTVTTDVVPTAPTYVSGTHTLTIPTKTGVIYQVDGETIAAGSSVITESTLVVAVAAPGYRIVGDEDWYFEYV